MMDYFRNIRIATKTLSKGLGLTMRHLKDARTQRDPLAPTTENYFEKQNAIFTVQYPKEVLPVPTVGRYKLHNEIEDCIVCDKCAKICPVDCIDIEPVRSVEEFGKTSDGTPKRIYAAKFDIDMAKCCFCGLCTTVCPTECLTMTDDYDFSTFDLSEHNFEFGNMTPLEILEKKEELAAFQKKKEEAKASSSAATAARPKVSGAKPAMKPKTGMAKPMMRPKSGASTPVTKPKTSTDEGASERAKPKIIMKPKIAVKKPAAKPVIKPKQKDGETEEKPKMAKPKTPMKPKIPPKKKDEE